MEKEKDSGKGYYHIEAERVLSEFKVDSARGLSSSEAAKRLQKYGFNELKEKKKINPFIIFVNQFRSFIIYILLFAVAISALTGEFADTAVIMAILVFNAFFGFVQEYKAEKAIESLRKLSGFKARVIRGGKRDEIDTKMLVPGDIIIIEEGDKASADARIIEQKSLKISEASLTGESIPVSKTEEVLKNGLVLADRKNMVFSGTSVVKGRGICVVVSTGMNTEIGKIAAMITEIEKEKTPLQKKLQGLGRWIGLATIIISAAVFFAGVLNEGLISLLKLGEYFEFIVQGKEWFLTAVALAVAAVPEGLPAIVTIALALGVRRMLKRNALVRRLPSVETLGSTNVICCDKTGTLTKNEMTVRKCYVNSRDLEVGGRGYSFDGKIKDLKERDRFLFEVGVLCNNASFGAKGKVIGEPTEAALLVSAEKAEMNHERFRKMWRRIDEEPFDSERKMMSVVCKNLKSEKEFVFTKGAPEKIAERCDRILINGKILKFDSRMKRKILEKNEELAKCALRVLGFAYKNYTSSIKEKEWEKNLVFVGLQGMIDPPRKEVKDSVRKCKEAGIRIIIVTGDNKHTAKAIASEVGIKGEAVDGVELEKMSAWQKKRAIDKISVFARVEPKHKMEIVTLLQNKGDVVAMTGDGVNDAPAIKKADIGIAMGIKGTDVAKETSDMVLLDDNFTSIVDSVEEGRGIYENIRKFVNYLLSSNVAEVLVIFLAILFGLPLPMTAIMLLWINLVTDGLPALSLSVDPNPKNLMKRKPRKKNDKIMNRSMMFNVLYVAVLITAAVLGLFIWAGDFYKGLDEDMKLMKMQTVVFTAIVVMELVRLYTIRSEYKLGIFSNKWLVLAVLVSLALHLSVIYTPLNNFFGTVFLSLRDWGMIVGIAFAVSVLNILGVKIKNKINWFDA